MHTISVISTMPAIPTMHNMHVIIFANTISALLTMQIYPNISRTTLAAICLLHLKILLDSIFLSIASLTNAPIISIASSMHDMIFQDTAAMHLGFF